MGGGIAEGGGGGERRAAAGRASSAKGGESGAGAPGGLLPLQPGGWRVGRRDSGGDGGGRFCRPAAGGGGAAIQLPPTAAAASGSGGRREERGAGGWVPGNMPLGPCPGRPRARAPGRSRGAPPWRSFLRRAARGAGAAARARGRLVWKCYAAYDYWSMCVPDGTLLRAEWAWDFIGPHGPRSAASDPRGTLPSTSWEPAADAIGTTASADPRGIFLPAHDWDGSPGKVIRHPTRRATRPLGGAGLSSGSVR